MSDIEVAVASAMALAIGVQTFMVSAYCNGGSSGTTPADRYGAFKMACFIAGSSAAAISL